LPLSGYNFQEIIAVALPLLQICLQVIYREV